MPKMKEKTMLDTSLHERRRAERLRDSEFRAAYERAAREIAQVDEVIRKLDALRVEQNMSKAELARRVARNPSSIRRLFTSHQARPEFPLLANIADVLGAELTVVRREAGDSKRVVQDVAGARPTAGSREARGSKRAVKKKHGSEKLIAASA